MARRLQLQGICNDLLDSFSSRYNDLDGYWCLGVFQSHLQKRKDSKLYFDLVTEMSENQKTPFFQTSRYYRSALKRHLENRCIPFHWVADGMICVWAVSPGKLVCSISVKTDLGRQFSAEKQISARPHDPFVELRSGGKHGPKNQKGE